VIVGSLGLASNIVGLFLFQGKLLHSPSNFLTTYLFIYFLEHGHSHGHSHKRSTPSSSASSVVHIPTDGRIASGSITPTQKHFIPTSPSHSRHSHTESYSSLYGHPAATRASLVQTANEMASAQSPTAVPSRGNLLVSDSASQIPVSESPQPNEVSTENTPLLRDEEGHNHKHDNHAQGSMNMRALVLHVVGDALGNVGVILTGLIIWLSTWQYKYYCDPVISLIITVIIFSNSLPLGAVIFIIFIIHFSCEYFCI
jgi:zinc transporter 1